MNGPNNPIGWCNYTWSPWAGCLGPNERGRCHYCYAQRLANGRLRHLYLSNTDVAPGCKSDDPFSPRIWRNRLYEPVRLKTGSVRPWRIFVNNMSDFCGLGIPSEWQDLVLSVIRGCPQHIFQILTKRPQELSFFDWPKNAWVGATATDQEMIDRALKHLKKVDAKVKFISFEPLLGPVRGDFTGLQWAIIGGQTSPMKIPEANWLAELVYDLDVANVPVFLKRNLKIRAEAMRQEWPR